MTTREGWRVVNRSIDVRLAMNTPYDKRLFLKNIYLRLGTYTAMFAWEYEHNFIWCNYLEYFEIGGSASYYYVMQLTQSFQLTLLNCWEWYPLIPIMWSKNYSQNVTRIRTCIIIILCLIVEKYLFCQS